MSPTAHLTLRSSNSKTGAIPVSTTSADSCPPTCPLKEAGCYANGGPIAIHWKLVTQGARGTSWEEFCDTIATLPNGTLWRHNRAGDLPGRDGIIDHEKLSLLVEANSGRRGFSYTHYPSTKENIIAIEEANRRGFCVNLSADNLSQADELARLVQAPVVSLIPSDAPERTFTPEGRKVIQCPAQTRDDVSCMTCGLCARVDRQIIIGFTPHGSGAKAANEIASATSPAN